MWEITRNSMSNSNIHGVSQMIYARFFSMKVIWFCLFLTAICLSFWNVGRLILKYMSEPTSLTNLPDAAAFISPDIHICYLHNFAISRLLYPSESSAEAMKFLQRQLKKAESNYPTELTEYDLRSSYFWSSISLSGLYEVGGERAEQVLVEAYRPNYEPIPASQFQVVYNSDHFLCFRYQPDDNLFTNSEDFLLFTLYLDSYHESQFNKTFLGNYWNGYEFGSDHQKIVYPDGYVMYFTERGRYPYPDQAYVLISGGQLVNVNLKMTTRRRVSTKSSPCQTSASSVEWQNPLLSPYTTMSYKVGAFGDCVERKLVERSVSQCGCYSHRNRVNVSMTNQYTVCGNASSTGMTPAIVKSQLLCFKNVKNDKDASSTDQANCLTERQCNDIDYDLSWSSLYWPTWSTLNSTIYDNLLTSINAKNAVISDIPGLLEYKKVMETNNLTVEGKMMWTQQNFARVSIRTGQVRGAILTESLSYDISAFTSEVGGAMGFYMGLSVLAVCEILEILHDWFLIFCLKVDLQEAEKEKRERKKSLPMQEWLDDGDHTIETTSSDHPVRISIQESFSASTLTEFEERDRRTTVEQPVTFQLSVDLPYDEMMQRSPSRGSHKVRFSNDTHILTRDRVRKNALAYHEWRPNLDEELSKETESSSSTVRRVSLPHGQLKPPHHETSGESNAASNGVRKISLPHFINAACRLMSLSDSPSSPNLFHGHDNPIDVLETPTIQEVDEYETVTTTC